MKADELPIAVKEVTGEGRLPLLGYGSMRELAV
jgi:hypothetical protein